MTNHPDRFEIVSSVLWRRRRSIPVTMRLGDATLELEPGSFVCVPPGVVHTFSNPSDAPVRFLNFNTPAGWEYYMRDLAAALASGTPTQEEIGEIASRYDFQVV